MLLSGSWSSSVFVRGPVHNLQSQKLKKQFFHVVKFKQMGELMAKKRPRLELSSLLETKSKYEDYKCFDNAAATIINDSEDALLDGKFFIDSFGLASVTLSSNGLQWESLDNSFDIGIACCLGSFGSSETPNRLSISEIYAVEYSSNISQYIVDSSRPIVEFEMVPSGESQHEEHCFVVYTFERSSSQKGTWIPKALKFQHPEKSVCEKWVNEIQSNLNKDINRPKNLMVIVNPLSGKKTAWNTWEEVSTLFLQAKIKTNVVKTERTRHAFDIMNNIGDEELEGLDGVVVVGGDGLFNEVLNGLLLRRHFVKYPSKPYESQKLQNGSAENSLGGLNGSPSNNNHEDSAQSFNTPALQQSVLYKDGGFILEPLSSNGDTGRKQLSKCFRFPNQSFRIGIIPAGSTDCAAVSTTGSRNATTSALHIIFGENIPLDVARLISWKSSASASSEELPRVRYAASFAGYGFYGDVIKESEPNRWMGPMRYDYAGTKVFLQHKAYDAEISFIEVEDNVSIAASTDDDNGHIAKKRGINKICCMNCQICQNGVAMSHFDNADIRPDSHPEDNGNWKSLRGFFISVGAAVISCRSDKAPNGFSPTAHLSDGLLHLVLVKQCSRLAYLWHLIQLTIENGDPLDFAFVEVLKTPRFNFISHGEESVWNVDGELFPAHQLTAEVFRGLVNIFASGPPC